MISIKQIKTSETYPLRIEILRNNKPENYHFLEDNNKDTIHLGAFNNNNIVGIVSLMKNNHTEFTDQFVFQLRGMAVKKEIQKQGIGKQLILESLNHLKKKIVQFYGAMQGKQQLSSTQFSDLVLKEIPFE